MRFLTAFFGPKRDPAPVPGSLQPMPAADATSVTGGITLREQRHRYLQCLGHFGHLAPRQASVAAFVTSLQDYGWSGEWDYQKLLREYDIVCKGTGAIRMPAKWFWKGLEGQGCHRWRAEREKDGNYENRHRPYVVWVPRVASDHGTDAARPPDRVVSLHRSKKTGFAPRKSVEGQRSVGHPKSGWQEKGVYRAGIDKAVASR